MDETVSSSLTFPDRQAVSRVGLAKGVVGGMLGPHCCYINWLLLVTPRTYYSCS